MAKHFTLFFLLFSFTNSQNKSDTIDQDFNVKVIRKKIHNKTILNHDIFEFHQIINSSSSLIRIEPQIRTDYVPTVQRNIATGRRTNLQGSRLWSDDTQSGRGCFQHSYDWLSRSPDRSIILRANSCNDLSSYWQHRDKS